MTNIKNLLLPIFAIFLYSSLSAQCPFIDVKLDTQQEVDEFTLLYPNCTELTGNLTIGGFTPQGNVKNLLALEQIEVIAGDLFIGNNDSLSALTGLDNITSAKHVGILNNATLSDLTALTNITELEEGLYIGFNDSLSSLAGLENITFIGHSFFLRNNPILTGLAVLNDALLIQGNGLNITDNSNLSFCNVTSICDYLESGLAAEIHDNAPNCNSKEEIEAACLTIGVEDAQNIHNFSVFPIPANDKIQLQVEDKHKALEVNILNLIGEVIHQQTVDVFADTSVSFDVSAYSPGIYFMSIYNGGKTITKRFVKQ